MQSIVFIINPNAGTGVKGVLPAMIDRSLDHSRYSCVYRYTGRAGEASELAAAAAAGGTDIVVAVGGDGTVNEVARALADTDTALGVVPCGSGNGLARHLMLPMNVRGAVEVINQGTVHALDYGVINGQKFFCTCGMGFDAFISKKFAAAGRRGPITYIENVLREGLKFSPETYHITLDGNAAVQHEAFLLSVANASQYGNDAYIAPQASMSDGWLDVVIIRPFDLLDAPQVALDLMNKTLDMNSKIRTFRARDIVIRREHAGVIHFDGEPAEAAADLHITLRCGGIRVVVNPMADKKRRQPNVVQTTIAQLGGEISTVREEGTQAVRTIARELTQLANSK